ncbi:MAG: TonB-dependent receptor [Verrucomicrobia bacterium]|nr:TonB-dependent receptor [Verrucomicrobiota bacterium]
MGNIFKFLAVGSLVGTALLGNAELEPMVVSALRLETETKNLPASVQVIDAEKIEQSGSTDLVGLLRKEANLQVRSTSGNSARSTVSMGGFGENGQLRTLVLLDGHRVNAIDMSAINWYSIPLALVESIEVIRGGQSGTYGNHAVGGVIKINTKAPRLKPAGSLETSAGSFGYFNARGAYSQMIGEMGLTLFGEHAQSDGYRVNGDHQTDSGGVRLDWGSKSDLKGYFSWSWSDTKFGLPGDLNASALTADRRQTDEPKNRGQQRTPHGRAGISYEISEDWSLENRFGYQDSLVKVDMPSAMWIADTSYESFSYSSNLHYQSMEADWMIGWDFVEDKVAADTNFEDSDLQRKTIAAFASTSHAFTQGWIWNANLRIEEIKNNGKYGDTVLNEVKQQEWAGGIGLVHELGTNHRTFGAIRRFYRYPATDEILLAWPPPSSFDPDLEAENGFEIELGLDLSNDKLSFSGRIFQQWMEKEVIFDPSTFSNTNLDDTHRVGLDLQVNWDINEFMLGGLSYEYVRAKFDKGDYSGSHVPLVPEGLLRVFLEIRPTDVLSLSLGGSYVGENYRGSDFSNTEPKLEDYWLYDLGLNYQLSEGATLFGGVENLLDEEYLSTAFGTALYPGEGRKVRVGLRYSF